MAQSFEFDGLYTILKYAVIIILGFILIRHLFRLLKPSVFAFVLNYCRITNPYHRQEIFSTLPQLKKEISSGKILRILEIGIGGGTNFKYYPKNTQVIAVEPNGSFDYYMQKNVQKYEGVELVEVINRKIEDLGNAVEDESIDAVVGTLVLCSVEDEDAAMREIIRVLKPNGRYYFMEHVKDFHRNSWTHIGQRLIYPFVLALGDCNCLKDTHVYIDRAGFSSHTYRRLISEKMPVFFRPTLIGYATK